MRFLGLYALGHRIKAIPQMLRDKSVPWTKKLLVIFGLIYLFLPVDLIPPVVFPFGFIDDIILWIWIIWTLRDTLDSYWDNGEKDGDLSENYSGKNVITDVDYNVEENEDGGDSRQDSDNGRTDSREGEGDRSAD